MVIGNVLGAGIYVITGEVIDEMGGAAWLAFLTAFVVVALSALSLCELVTKYPGAAGIAIYVERAFGRPTLSFAVGLAVLASGLTSAATAATAFGGDYLTEIATFDSTAAAAAFLLTLTAINYWGVLASLRANLVMTLIEVVGLLVVIAAAATIITSGDGDLARPLGRGEGDAIVPLALLGGAAIAFFSFLGFEDVANMSEEVRRPWVSYPVALFGGLAVTATLYIAVVFLATAAVAPERIARSSGPLLVVVDESPLDISATTFATIALVAVANTALMNLVMGSRLLYGMAARGLMPAPLGAIDRRRRTPWLAVLATGGAALALAASGDLGALARTTVLLLLSVLLLMNVSAIRLAADTVAHDYFRSPRWAPWLGAAACAGLIANQVATESPADIVRAVVVVGAGLVVYWLAGGPRAARASRLADFPHAGSGAGAQARARDPEDTEDGQAKTSK